MACCGIADRGGRARWRSSARLLGEDVVPKQDHLRPCSVSIVACGYRLLQGIYRTQFVQRPSKYFSWLDDLDNGRKLKCLLHCIISFNPASFGPSQKMAALPITWKDGGDVHTYEKARIGRVFNHRRPDRYPVAVIEATEESHTVDAVRLAKEKKCRLSVRSGGHSWAAWSVRDDAILLDLGQYKQIDLDEKTGIVKVSPSTTGRMLNGFLTTKGLLFAGGHCPDVGLGGFLLQGGMGWNCKVSIQMSEVTEDCLTWESELGLGLRASCRNRRCDS